MNQAHLHLLLNHTPILGSLFGFVLLLIAVVRRLPGLTRTGLGTLLAAAVLAVPTNATGEGAERVIQHQPGISQALIEAHAQSADYALGAIGLTGALALLSLVLLARAPARAVLFTRLTLLVAGLSFGLLARTGNLGGQISHPETRQDAVSQALGR